MCAVADLSTTQICYYYHAYYYIYYQSFDYWFKTAENRIKLLTYNFVINKL